MNESVVTRRRTSGSRKTSSLEAATRNFIDNVLDIRMTIPHRAAAALNYFGETIPKVIIPYNILYQAVLGVARQPQVGSKDVKRFQGRMTDVAKILHEKYGRGKHTVTGVGIRATVDSADRLVTEAPKKNRNVEVSLKSLNKTMNGINIKEVPNTPELKPYREWYMTNHKQLLESSNDLLKRLLPPMVKKKDA